MIEFIITLVILLLLVFKYLLWYEHRNNQKHWFLTKPEKRTYLFEDDEGNRINPFTCISEGAKQKEEKDYKY